MAKKKNSRLGTTISKQNQDAIVSVSHYSPFIIVELKDKKFRDSVKVWFEKNTDTGFQSKLANHQLLKGRTAKEWLVDKTAGPQQEIQKEAAILFSKWALQSARDIKTIASTYQTIMKFLKFCTSKYQLKSIYDVSPSTIVEFREKNVKGSDVSTLRNIFPTRFRRLPIHTIKNKSTFDDEVENILGNKGFSDTVLMQILGYASYNLNFIKERWDWLVNVDEKSLEYNGYLVSKQDFIDHKKPDMRSALGRIMHLYPNDKDKAVTLLHQNFLVIGRSLKFKTPFSKHKTFAESYFFSHLTGKLNRYSKDLHRDFISHVAKLYEREQLDGPFDWKRTYLLTFPGNESSVILLLLCQTGVNKEVILSLVRKYGSLHWKERLDIYLGSDTKKLVKRSVLRLTGKKTRGVSSKNVDLRVPVNSFTYDVLELWENIFASDDSELFYSQVTNKHSMTAFCARYPIYEESGHRLTEIDTTKIRKVYAGINLVSILESTNSAGELSRRLREALNHKIFDTTMLSYIFKTGAGNFVYSTAVVALTTKMFEEALEFKGCVGKDNVKSTANTPVYLCDCTDITKPTHGVPIASKCTFYDLCLGCERSIVFAEHVPRICFRVLQYENTPAPTNELLADRKAIALNCLEQFRSEHPEGDLIVDHSFELAKNAMANDEKLLPPIL